MCTYMVPLHIIIMYYCVTSQVKAIHVIKVIQILLNVGYSILVDLPLP